MYNLMYNFFNYIYVNKLKIKKYNIFNEKKLKRYKYYYHVILTYYINAENI